MKRFISILLVAIAFAGCIDDSSAEEQPQTSETSAETFTTLLTLGEELTGHNGVIDWSTQDWLLGNAPPTYTYTFNETIRITSAIAEITYNFPNPVMGGGVRTELTTWHGVRVGPDAMSAHGFFDGPDQHTGGALTATFDLEVPGSGLITGPELPYVFSVGHYYTDGVGPKAPTVTGTVNITYAPATMPQWGEPTNESGNLLGGLCVLPADIEARVDLPLPIESTEGLRILIEGNNQIGDVLGDVDFFVTDPYGERIMHGASPGNKEYVALGPEGFSNLTEEDTLTLTIFNCHPQASNIQYQIQWAQT